MNISKYDFFVCCSRTDQGLVLPFCEKLKSEGFRLFLDSECIESGSSYATFLINGVESSSVVLLFYSRNVIGSTWCKKEIELALSMNKKIIPILLDNTNLSGWWNLLANKQCVRLDNLRFDEAWKQFYNYLKENNKVIFSSCEVSDCSRSLSPKLESSETRKATMLEEGSFISNEEKPIMAMREANKPESLVDSAPIMRYGCKKRNKILLVVLLVVFIIILFVVFSLFVRYAPPRCAVPVDTIMYSDEGNQDRNMKYLQEMEAEIQNMEAEIQNKYAKYEQEKDNMTDSIRRVQEEELMGLQQRLQTYQALQQETQKKQVELIQPLHESTENIFLNRLVFWLCFCSVVSFVIGGVIVWFVCRKKIKNNIDIVGPQHDKLIKCFIAGSKSLQRERDGLRSIMSVMYNKWMNFNFKILSFTFEDFDKKVVIGGQQKLYNSFIEKDADWALFIIDKGIGDKTHEEYRIAMDSYINNGRPNIVIFGKLGISDMSELSTIKEEVEKHGQYWVDYSDIDNLKLSFESILNWDLINIFKESLKV